MACFFAVIWALSILSYLFSPEINIPPLVHPLCLGVFFLLFLLNPIHILHFKARRWLLRVLVSVVMYPAYCTSCNWCLLHHHECPLLACVIVYLYYLKWYLHSLDFLLIICQTFLNFCQFCSSNEMGSWNVLFWNTSKWWFDQRPTLEQTSTFLEENTGVRKS